VDSDVLMRTDIRRTEHAAVTHAMATPVRSPLTGGTTEVEQEILRHADHGASYVPYCRPVSPPMEKTRRGGGHPPFGKRQAGKEHPIYDPTSGKSYRTGVTLPPEEAQLLIAVADRANMSISGVLNVLVKNMDLDPTTGLPSCINPPERFQEAS
jgi:hypothetical protein